MFGGSSDVALRQQKRNWETYYEYRGIPCHFGEYNCAADQRVQWNKTARSWFHIKAKIAFDMARILGKAAASRSTAALSAHADLHVTWWKEKKGKAKLVRDRSGPIWVLIVTSSRLSRPKAGGPSTDNLNGMAARVSSCKSWNDKNPTQIAFRFKFNSFSLIISQYFNLNGLRCDVMRLKITAIKTALSVASPWACKSFVELNNVFLSARA